MQPSGLVTMGNQRGFILCLPCAGQWAGCPGDAGVCQGKRLDLWVLSIQLGRGEQVPLLSACCIRHHATRFQYTLPL